MVEYILGNLEPGNPTSGGVCRIDSNEKIVWGPVSWGYSSFYKMSIDDETGGIFRIDTNGNDIFYGSGIGMWFNALSSTMEYYLHPNCL